jgi:pectate lyase-like protein
MSTTTTYTGIRIVDMPDLGAVDNTSSMVGERAGSGRFAATAFRDWLLPMLSFGTVTALRAASPVTSPVYVLGYAAAGDGGQGTFLRADADTTSADNGGTVVIDASGRRWHRDAPASVVRVEWFGAKGDGTTDDAAAINNAVAALPAAGGMVLFEARAYKVGSTITLGNGSTAAGSTRAGVVLSGTGGTYAPDMQPYTSATGTRLVWSGGAAEMIHLAGAVHGCGVKNMLLDGSSAATVGIRLVSASFGDFENISVRNCTSCISATVNTSGLSNNSMNNRFHNIFLVPSAVASATGIMLDGTTAGNSCFNDLENVVIQLPTSGTCWGVYLKGADTNSFRNLLVVYGGASATSVIFDYTGAGIGNWPEGNAFYNADVAANAGTVQWANVGTGNSSARPNMVYGIGQANGGSYPDIDNLSVDLPSRQHTYSAVNVTASIGTFALMTPRVPGLFRISYMLFIQATGTAGTIQPVFSWTSQATAQTASGTAVNAASGGNTQGSVTAYGDTGAAINMRVDFAGITGAPRYAIYLAIERLI